jgi:hypothetical protein
MGQDWNNNYMTSFFQISTILMICVNHFLPTFELPRI